MSKIFYSDKYEVDIGSHVFPTEKYRLIKEKLIEDKVIAKSDVVEPPFADQSDMLLVHTEKWLAGLRDGTISVADQMRLELPYSPRLYEASMVCAGGTVAACGESLKNGVGVHIGSGFHHSFADHGEGFCVFNDIAVGIRAMLKGKKIRKACVVDLDVHHGNGTADIFRGDPDRQARHLSRRY